MLPPDYLYVFFLAISVLVMCDVFLCTSGVQNTSVGPFFLHSRQCGALNGQF